MFRPARGFAIVLALLARCSLTSRHFSMSLMRKEMANSRTGRQIHSRSLAASPSYSTEFEMDSPLAGWGRSRWSCGLRMRKAPSDRREAFGSAQSIC